VKEAQLWQQTLRYEERDTYQLETPDETTKINPKIWRKERRVILPDQKGGSIYLHVHPLLGTSHPLVCTSNFQCKKLQEMASIMRKKKQNEPVQVWDALAEAENLLSEEEIHFI
jgi:hypothetical protein